jgi:uncharacterized protein
MSRQLHALTVQAFARALRNLSAILDKTSAHAEAKKIDPAVLLGSRLYPDMFPLMRQVQLASDFAKGSSARLAGLDVPAYEDTETSIADLKARIDKTLAFIEAIGPEKLADADTRKIEVKARGQVVASLPGVEYAMKVGLPNFHFHCVTAYNILRHNGVELGKRDFIGAVAQ